MRKWLITATLALIGTGCSSMPSASSDVTIEHSSRIPAMDSASSSKHITVSEAILAQRVFSSLALSGDPLVKISADRVTVAVDGHSIDCFNGIIKTPQGNNTQVSTCDFDFALGVGTEVSGRLADIIYKGLVGYILKNPNDSLAAQKSGPGGVMVSLTSGLIPMPGSAPQQILNCSSFRGSGPTCNVFSLYGLIPKDDAMALFLSLPKDSEYGDIIGKMTDMAATGGYAFKSLSAWKNISGVTKLIATYSQPAVRAGRMVQTRFVVIDADSSAAGSIRVNGAFIGRD